MSASVSSRRGGQPSTTTPTPPPWDSPQVVTRKRWPKVFAMGPDCGKTGARSNSERKRAAPRWPGNPTDRLRSRGGIGAAVEHQAGVLENLDPGDVLEAESHLDARVHVGGPEGIDGPDDSRVQGPSAWARSADLISRSYISPSISEIRTAC